MNDELPTKDDKKRKGMPWWGWVLIGIFALGGLANVFNGGTAPPSQSSQNPVPDEAEISTSSPALVEEQDSVYGNESVGEENARKSAESYLRFSAFSRLGLIEQLLYEGFSQQEAEYGVDAQRADWNEQAVKSAESYLRFSAFSRSGLISQLEYEGFTSIEATYGVDSVGADWNEQAAKSAESYLKFSSFSRTGLIDQLIYEGFSQSEAEYGVSQNGY